MKSEPLAEKWTEMSEGFGTRELRTRKPREAWKSLFQICGTLLICCSTFIAILINLEDLKQPLTGLVVGPYFGQELKTPNSTNLEEKLPECRVGSTQKKTWFNVKVDESAQYTTTLLELLRANSTMPSACSSVATNSTVVEGLPNLSHGGRYLFKADVVHHLTLVAIGTDGMRRCAGGDYYEVDLHDRANLTYRSRLPTVDRGDGTYELELVVPSQFSGEFTLDIWLLFSNWHGLEHKTESWVKQTLVLTVELDVVIDWVDRDQANADQLESYVQRDKGACYDHGASLALKRCTQADFSRNNWQGRWTRSWFNNSCEADGVEKRFRCLPEEHYACPEPWCFGPVGRLESNGWHYSAHCSFRIFEPTEAWQCLNDRWLYVWGDSNFQDTIRNLLLFVLDWELPRGKNLATFQLERNYESFFYNAGKHQRLQVSSHFNGAHPPWIYGAGLSTLEHELHQQKLLSHFNGTKWPDTIIMNSGLHDGDQFDSVDNFTKSADFMVQWWIKLYNTIPAGRKPLLIWRTTIAPAGKSRKMMANPNKMEMFNQIIVEKLQEVKDILPVHIVDAFDLTFPFHYDNEYSDGGHYGRSPGYVRRPYFGRPHWYFVDLMVAHILLNAACPTFS